MWGNQRFPSSLSPSPIGSAKAAVSYVIFLFYPRYHLLSGPWNAPIMARLPILTPVFGCIHLSSMRMRQHTFRGICKLSSLSETRSRADGLLDKPHYPLSYRGSWWNACFSACYCLTTTTCGAWKLRGNNIYYSVPTDYKF